MAGNRAIAWEAGVWAGSVGGGHRGGARVAVAASEAVMCGRCSYGGRAAEGTEAAETAAADASV